MSTSDEIFEKIAAKTSLAISKKATKEKYVGLLLIKNNKNNHLGHLAVKPRCWKLWSSNLELDKRGQGGWLGREGECRGDGLGGMGPKKEQGSLGWLEGSVLPEVWSFPAWALKSLVYHCRQQMGDRLSIAKHMIHPIWELARWEWLPWLTARLCMENEGPSPAHVVFMLSPGGDICICFKERKKPHTQNT